MFDVNTVFSFCYNNNVDNVAYKIVAAQKINIEGREGGGGISGGGGGGGGVSYSYVSPESQICDILLNGESNVLTRLLLGLSLLLL